MRIVFLKNLTSFASKFTKSVYRITSGICGGDRYERFEAAGANILAAGSRITDAESAREIIRHTKSKILSRAALSVSGQANQKQRKIIDLIQT